MYAKRREQLRQIISQANTKYDAVLIDSPENLYYFTGFTGGEAVFVMYNDIVVDEIDNGKTVSDFNNLSNANIISSANIVSNISNKNTGDMVSSINSEECMYIITDSRYYEQVEKECPDIPLIRLEGKTYIETIKEIFSGKLPGAAFSRNSDDLMSHAGDEMLQKIRNKWNNGLAIAIEDSMNLSRYLKLKDALTSCELTVASELIDNPRTVKDKNELELLARAEQIGDEAFTHILDIIKPGITEREIALELEFYMKRQGASKLSFDTIVASGPNSSMPHAQVTDRVIENGDFVTMDFGCVYKGYCSDMTRTIAVGTPIDEMKKVYQIVLEANLRAMEGIRAGVKCSDIDALARGYIAEQGYGDYFGHGLGHSVGLYIHEEPRFSPKCDVIIKENMVITDEPGIYIPGRFGVRIEDLVVVKKDGYKRLSNSPKELVII